MWATFCDWEFSQEYLDWMHADMAERFKDYI